MHQAPSGLVLPDLYALGVDQHWIDPDLNASGLGDVRFCPECMKSTSGSMELMHKNIQVDSASVDTEASDFFRFRPRGMSLFVFVTQRVVEVARAERWTNARFIPSDRAFKLSQGSGVNYLAKDWPPAGWDKPM